MADWLKLNHSLVRSPKVRGLMRELRCNKMTALGLAVSWLCWIDEQTTDGRTNLLPDELAEEIGFRGGVEALISIGWAALGEDGCVVACEFGKHCGDSAKKRAEDARRQSNKRARDREVCHGVCHGKSVTGVTDDVTGIALPEKNRIYVDTEGSLSTTVDTGSPEVPCPPAPDGFVSWLQAVGSAVPMLRRLNLDRPLPRRVEAAARDAWLLVPMVPESVELLRRYYAAESVDKGWRPDSLERFFEDLPDVLQHAANWCRQDDRRQRKAAATARRRAQDCAARAAECREAAATTEEERERFFRELRGGGV